MLVLDRTHHVLMAGDRLPEIAFAGPRPLKTVVDHFTTLALELPAPAGSQPGGDGGRDFAFVIDRVAAPLGHSWRPLREVTSDDVIWSIYIGVMLGGYQPPVRAVDVWSFGDRPEMAAQLAHLVINGGKRATMGWIAAAQRQATPLAYSGGVSVVTDSFGYPRCVVRSTEVHEYAFRDVPAAAAAAEAEGDLTYDDWREGHQAYFTREAERLGLVFDDAAVIAVEYFELLWPRDPKRVT